MKQQKNSLYFPTPTRNTCKVANKLMTVASGEINLQSKHNLIRHIVKMKDAMSANFIADVRYILFESNASIKRKENIFYIHIKKNNIHVLMFKKLLANKHHRLCDSKCASGSLGLVSDKTINHGKTMNHAWPMAAQLIIR